MISPREYLRFPRARLRLGVLAPEALRLTHQPAGGSQKVVSSPFSFGVGDATSERQMIGAESVGEQNQLLWRNYLGNFLYTWNLDANWTWQPCSGGTINPLSAAALGLETNFPLHLNGNGLIGT